MKICRAIGALPISTGYSCVTHELEVSEILCEPVMTHSLSTKRSSNWIANRVFAACHEVGGSFSRP